jgi:tetratricopeptide (TPR) repeat protein
MDWRRCEFAEGRELSRESLEIHRALGDEPGVAQALNNLGWIALFEGDYDSATAVLGECLTIRRRLGHTRNTAFVLTALAWATLRRGDESAASQLLAEAIGLFRGIGERQLQAFALRVSSELAIVRGDAAEGARLLESESLPVFREIGDRWGLMYALGIHGDALRLLGRRDDAQRAYDESRSIAEALGDRYGLASSDARYAILAVDAGDAERAAMLADRADALLKEIGGALPPQQRVPFERARYTARALANRVSVH